MFAGPRPCRFARRVSVVRGRMESYYYYYLSYTPVQDGIISRDGNEITTACIPPVRTRARVRYVCAVHINNNNTIAFYRRRGRVSFFLDVFFYFLLLFFKSPVIYFESRRGGKKIKIKNTRTRRRRRRRNPTGFFAGTLTPLGSTIR